MRKLIVLLPAADETTASSRIRIFTLARELQKKGIPYTFNRVLNPSAVIIQKHVTDDIIQYVKKTRQLGALIIYDIDDLGEALYYWVKKELLLKILQLADIVVTATHEQSLQVKEIFPVKHILPIENCVDYYPSHPMRIPPSPRDPLRLLWFGNSSNLTLLEKYLDKLISIPKLEVVICADNSLKNIIAQNWPAVTFVCWDLSTFISTLQSCHLTCLMHDGTKEDRAKANNRMITSITWGVPAIVSNTPSYFRTAKDAGIDEFVFENQDEMLVMIEKLRDYQACQNYLDTAQKNIWAKYSPEAISEEYISILTSFSNKIRGIRKFFRLWR